MGVFDMVVIIVIVGCLTPMALVHLRTRQIEAQKMASGGMDETRERLEELEERMRVVESIVTDSRTNLSKEIDSL
ncbi:MAG: hypothetical protein O2780_20235 [Proteobacteria bacterium]|jgi:hypothetical protein|nr:hypothetical protein [Pseudomonadota bacterium]MDA1302344.1 hypothetical protein [Pseudomonadota bacterium]